YFSRRCCRKVSAERSRIEFTALTLLLESNSSQLWRQPFALDIFSSKNIIVRQILERPDHGGSGVFFQLIVSVGRRILSKVVHPLSRLRSGLTGTLVLLLSAFALTACIVTADQSVERNPKDPRAQDIAAQINNLDIQPRQVADSRASG